MNNELVDILIYDGMNLQPMNSSVFFWSGKNNDCYINFKLTDLNDNELLTYPFIILRLLIK